MVLCTIGASKAWAIRSPCVGGTHLEELRAMLESTLRLFLDVYKLMFTGRRSSCARTTLGYKIANR